MATDELRVLFFSSEKNRNRNNFTRAVGRWQMLLSSVKSFDLLLDRPYFLLYSKGFATLYRLSLGWYAHKEPKTSTDIIKFSV